MKIFNCLILLLCNNLWAQISPPGLGESNLASWNAIGLKLDINKNVQSFTYFGIGFKLNDDQMESLGKPAIQIYNQEFTHGISKNKEISYAGSYRKQFQYHKESTSTNYTTQVQQEFRIYGRFAYTLNLGKFKFKQTARQEIRRFVNQNFDNTLEPLQLRSRVKSQVSFYLENTNQHKITAGAEALFANSKNQNTKNWTGFKYKEARFTLFYTFIPTHTPLAISFGYMNNLIQQKTPHSVHYTSVDLVWENPFQIFKSKN